MPELPEVETIRQDLARVIIGKEIMSVEVLNSKPVTDGKKYFLAALKNTIITRIDRIGKLLMVGLSSDNFLLIHLKMTGQLLYRHKDIFIEGGHSLSTRSYILPDAYTWVIWKFRNGGTLYFNDMRKFGYLKIVTAKEKENIVAGYGPEPLTKSFTRKNFFSILENRSAPIKAVLLNQKLIAGIGNIYADEICFEAGIFPGSHVSRLSLSDKNRLYAAINKILKKAIQYKGTTFKNYVSPHGKKGNFSDFLQVYKRDNQECRRCARGKIANKKIAGRSSRYCPVCQKMLH